ncbi:hypothetical protein MTO96_019801 [Rhipicephalus appendiculatus]
MFRSITNLFRHTVEREDLSPEPPTPAVVWDPIEYGKEEPTEECVLTVLRHIAELNDYRFHGVFVEPEDGDVTKIHALVLGPIGTPYEGGFFHFVLRCPSDYPERPPLVRMMTTDSGRVRFHPSIYENGKVCLALLGTDTTGPYLDAGQQYRERGGPPSGGCWRTRIPSPKDRLSVSCRPWGRG